MAKDGTNRGGVRVGAGRKRKSLDEKILEGQSVDAIKPVASDDMPPPKDYLSSVQKDGEKLCAAEIYSETWLWLKSRGCENLIDNQLIEQYAMCVARWRQCEQAVSRFGLRGRHPTTGGEMTSVYVKMAQDYLKLIAQLRYQIYSAVKENSTLENLPYEGNDDMENLLRAKG